MTACSHQCGGVCCRRFPLSASPARVAEMYQAAIADRAAGLDTVWTREIIMIAEMVIPLAEESDERPFYTCRHLDDATGLCTAYEQRPQMCRDYPGYDRGGTCDHCGFVQAPPEPELVQLKAAR